MKTIVTFISLCVLLSVTGCLSLHPLYTKEDVTFDESLLGMWVNEAEEETWTFNRKRENESLLEYTDKQGKSGFFVAHLLRLDESVFLNIFPDDSDEKVGAILDEINDFYKLHLIGLHSFMRMDITDETVKMAFMNYDAFKKHLEKHPDAISHTYVDDRIILTAQTPELRAFVQEHLETLFAWDDALVLTRHTEAVNDEQ